MKIRTADSTGCPAPQFVVEAETDEERLLLKMFLTFRDCAKDEWNFVLHGYSKDFNGYNSFNFGLAKPRLNSTSTLV